MDSDFCKQRRSAYFVGEFVSDQLLKSLIGDLHTKGTELNQICVLSFKNVMLPGDSFTSHANCYKVEEYYQHLCHCYYLHKKNHTVLLSHYDYLISLQLLLAKHNKQTINEFDVQVSDLLYKESRLLSKRLNEIPDEDDSEMDSSLIAVLMYDYGKFMENCSVSDHVQIYQLVKKGILENVNEIGSDHNEIDYIFIGRPQNKIQALMLQLLINERTSKKVQLNEIDRDLIEEKTVSVSYENMSDEELQTVIETRCSDCSSPSTNAAIQMHLDRLFVAYLRLLVNTRDELALATILCSPIKGISHKGFTALKHLAREKQIPLYHVALSFITNIRLGSNSYRPKNDCPLLQYTKVLSDFVTVLQKMQNVIEEQSDNRF